MMLNFFSIIFGKVASLSFPSFLQKRINKLFVNFFHIDLSHFRKVDEYHSLQNLFVRDLQKQRVFSNDNSILISPTDAKIAQFGILNKDTILQIKGLSYDLYTFLTEKAKKDYAQKTENGIFINFYLSPQDYHHFHAPCNFQIQKIIHVPGTLFPVKRSSLEKRKNLYIRNERVILECQTEKQTVFYFVAIGACCVGKIEIAKEPRLQTNILSNRNTTVFSYATPLEIKKGENLGHFEMGSSVVLLFEKGSVDLLPEIHREQKIQFGDNFAKYH